MSLPRDEQEKTVVETMASVLEDVDAVNRVIEHLSDLAEQKPLHIQERVLLKDVMLKVLRTSTPDQEERPEILEPTASENTAPERQREICQHMRKLHGAPITQAAGARAEHKIGTRFIG